MKRSTWYVIAELFWALLFFLAYLLEWGLDQLIFYGVFMLISAIFAAEAVILERLDEQDENE